jgi:hypothetical protein
MATRAEVQQLMNLWESLPAGTVLQERRKYGNKKSAKGGDWDTASEIKLNRPISDYRLQPPAITGPYCNSEKDLESLQRCGPYVQEVATGNLLVISGVARNGDDISVLIHGTDNGTSSQWLTAAELYARFVWPSAELWPDWADEAVFDEGVAGQPVGSEGVLPPPVYAGGLPADEGAEDDEDDEDDDDLDDEDDC